MSNTYLIGIVVVLALIVIILIVRRMSDRSGPSAVSTARTLIGPDSGSNILSVATALKERYVQPDVEWYRDKKVLPMMLYRTSGVITILLSVAIPVVAQSDWFKDSQKDVLATMGLIVAGLTGVSSFLGWDRIWRGRRQTETVLQHSIALWELELLRASRLDPEKANDQILEATKELLNTSHSVTLTEAEQFFEGLKPVGSTTSTQQPDAQKPAPANGGHREG